MLKWVSTDSYVSIFLLAAPVRSISTVQSFCSRAINWCRFDWVRCLEKSPWTQTRPFTATTISRRSRRPSWSSFALQPARPGKKSCCHALHSVCFVSLDILICNIVAGGNPKIILSMCSANAQCDPHSDDANNKDGCGNDFAMPYFISFYVLCSFLVTSYQLALFPWKVFRMKTIKKIWRTVLKKLDVCVDEYVENLMTN